MKVFKYYLTRNLHNVKILIKIKINTHGKYNKLYMGIIFFIEQKI